MEHIFRIFDFNVYNGKESSMDESSSNSDEENYNIRKDVDMMERVYI